MTDGNVLRGSAEGMRWGYTLSGHKIKDFGRGAGVPPLAGAQPPHPLLNQNPIQADAGMST
ncbi:MAG: hypothetical protein HC780_29690, partial [Leptolyngbyaceae cyanobacterium CSU_1_3]|nr:hypothetical protein [Leptolyngbyaceae cyanobacterium CSU_1_3]